MPSETTTALKVSEELAQLSEARGEAIAQLEKTSIGTERFKFKPGQTVNYAQLLEAQKTSEESEKKREIARQVLAVIDGKISACKESIAESERQAELERRKLAAEAFLEQFGAAAERVNALTWELASALDDVFKLQSNDTPLRLHTGERTGVLPHLALSFHLPLINLKSYGGSWGEVAVSERSGATEKPNLRGLKF